MKQQKLLNGFIAFILLLLSTASRAYDFEVDNIQYTITSFDDLTVEISGLENNNVTEVIIREIVEYRDRVLTVTSIGNKAFASNEQLQYIYIPGTIISIGDEAFSGCNKLSEISLPNSVTSLGESAFANTGLKEISIPNNVSELYSTFYGCSTLSKVSLPDNLKTLGANTFYNCQSLSEISLPEGLASIGSSAFYGCSSLVGIDIPNSVVSLGKEALIGCTNLEYLAIGDELSTLIEKEETNQYPTYHEMKYYPLLWTSGPTQMRSIVLKNSDLSFEMRGYGASHNHATSYYYGYPIFSKIDIKYYYVGRELTNISSWSASGYSYSITVSQPYGTIQTLEIGGYCTSVPYFYQSVEYLILDENVDSYTASNIYQDSLKYIMCKSATIPPVVSGTFNNSTYLNVVLYVPTGSKATYETTYGWKSFWEIVEMDVDDMTPEYTAVEGIVVNRQANATGYYTTDGKRVSQPQRGMNIIRYSDGSAKKVLVK